MSVGLGIRSELFEPVLIDKPELEFLEAHSENYFGESVLRAKLRELRQNYDISLHGVGLSLGRADNLDEAHLLSLKKLVDEIEPILVSEHLAWSAYSHRHLPDLLPLPLNEQSLEIMCAHIDHMQSVLQRQVLVENPSNYLLFDELQIPEPEFLNDLAKRTGCGLLVDVNNIKVSAHNVGRDPRVFIEQLDSHFIVQYHLAGYTEIELGSERLLIDTHDHPVYPEVWKLYRYTLQLHGPRPTLFEWDSDFPELHLLLAECDKAKQLAKEFAASANHENHRSSLYAGISTQNSGANEDINNSTAEFQKTFLDILLGGDEKMPQVVHAHQARWWIYRNNMVAATQDYLAEVYPAVRGVVGADYFKLISHHYIKAIPPSTGNIHLYGEGFEWLIDQFEALRELAYLHDLIRFEWALHQAYFCELVNDLDYRNLNQQQLLSMPTALKACVSIVKSDYPLLEIHRQSLPTYDQEVAINLSDGGDSLLVYKTQFAVKTHLLNDTEVLFIQELRKSENLLQAVEGAKGSLSTDELSHALACILELGVLCKVSDNGSSSKKYNDY